MIYTFVELDVACARESITLKELARRSQIKYDTFLAKKKGNSDFTRAEMFRIQKAFQCKIPLEILFSENSGDKKGA